jgi:UDP-4-amino-4,6-dideoxy-N-acetyl-beta-L-altrosamine transaminase
VEDVLKSNFLVQGPCVAKFEKAICDYTGAKYCVAVSSGTAALHVAVLALGVAPGDEGITTPNTFVATSNALIYGGLVPIFADIDERTFCLNPKEIKKKITAKTKVIIPVDFAGQPAEMEQIYSLARRKKIFVIEDAAHAIGSKYANGSRVGSCTYSDLTIFSFHPVKTITTGEGGCVTTNSKKLFERLILLRDNGITKNSKKLSQNPGPWYYEMQNLGFNYRLSDFKAALGLSQLKKLNGFVKRRHQIAKRYNKAFQDLSNLTVPFQQGKVESAIHIYVTQIDFEKMKTTRKEFMGELKKRGVGSQVHYIPVYRQPYYKKNFGSQKAKFPVCEKYYKSALTLPLFPRMSERDVDHVIKTILEMVS